MKKICYVIHPTHEIPKWSSVLDQFIKPAAQAAGYRCDIGLKMGAERSHIDKIVRPLLDADIVVADVTGGRDPATFYLLGVRHAHTNHGTILIAQNAADIPRDFQSYHPISYTPDLEGHPLFHRDFLALIEKIRSEPTEPDNPVQNILRQSVESSEEILQLRNRLTELEGILADKKAAPPSPRPQIKFKRVS